MKRLLIIIMTITMLQKAHAQQDGVYSHNMFNLMTVNPGYAGSTDMVNINALNRNQWMSLGNASPRNTVFSVNAPFTLFEKSHGAGLTIVNDQMGVSNNLGLQLAYAYRMKMKIGDGKLGIGGSAGIKNHVFKASGLVSNNDAAIINKDENSTIFDMGLGVYYTTDKLYLGISGTHLYTGNIKFKSISKESYYTVPHIYIAAGYILQLNNPMLQMVPSFYIQNGGNTTIVNFNTNIVYNNRIWGGVSYRSSNDVTALFGLELLAGIKFGVSYDYPMYALGPGISDGSLEVAVIYAFKLKKEKIPQKYKSIRFL